MSGCALLVDYVLTITVSVASGCDQLWSFLPQAWAHWKLPAEFVVLAALVVLNLRGVKESVRLLAPVFLLFIVTHAFVILHVLATHLAGMPEIVRDASTDFAASTRAVGLLPIALILLRADSLGGGTYTGIEAVSNGVAMLREPRVRTGRRTMALMAFSLAFTAGGILIACLLVRAEPVAGRTMNAVLFDRLYGSWRVGGVPLGAMFVGLCLTAEAALLFVAAQAGFLDGPRVLANMALDSWMPHRLAQLSDRLVAQDGILLMGLAAGAALAYTRGDIATLVVMYSINVFLTFSLTQAGMARHWIRSRGKERRWKRQLALHGAGFVLCVTILGITIFEKLTEGGWITLAATTLVILACHWIRAHYDEVRARLRRLDDVLASVPIPASAGGDGPPAHLDKSAPTAVICVTSFSGFGLHQILSIQRSLPRHFVNFVFVSAAVVDSGTFKGADELHRLQARTEEDLRRYVAWTRAHGLRADWRMGVGTEAVATAEATCRAVAAEFPRAIVFLGKLIFREERWYHRLLHNETALAIQRRLQFEGLQAIVLPIRVLDE